MSPYRIEMRVVGYGEGGKLLYKVFVYDKTNKVILSSLSVPKEQAVRHIMEYCYESE